LTIEENDLHKFLWVKDGYVPQKVKNFYVYIDEEHKIDVNGKKFNTFIYDFSDSKVYDYAILDDKFCKGLAYYNDEDSLTRLYFGPYVRNDEVEY
jgi:hypothetical protein